MSVVIVFVVVSVVVIIVVVFSGTGDALSCTFNILSKVKSFEVRAANIAEKESWIREISAAAR